MIGCLRTFEYVQAVDEVYHAVTVYRFVPRVAAPLRVDGMLCVAAVLQDVLETDAECRGIFFQKVLGYLCVPYKFVGIHGRVVVSATAVHAHIGIECHFPWQPYLKVGAV